jgi:hypothetical protein
MSEDEQTFSRIEALLALDKCKEAVGLINIHLKQDGPKQKLTCTLVDTLCQQGYRKRAEKVLVSYLSQTDSLETPPVDMMLFDLMNMQLAFLNPWNTAIFAPSLQTAIEIYNKYSSRFLESDWDAGNAAAVRLTSELPNFLTESR